MVGWHHRLQEIVKDREAWCAAVMGLQRMEHNRQTEQQQMSGYPGAFPKLISLTNSAVFERTLL